MAFTSSEKTKIRVALGYQSHSYDSNVRLESLMTTVGNDADAVLEIQSALAAIDAIETALVAARGTAGLKGVGQGDAEFFEGAKIKELRSEGRRYVNRISIILGVPVNNDCYGTSGSENARYLFAIPAGF